MNNLKKIPKVIHYFWFGKNPEPQIVKECIKSWKKYCPDYEIKRWDENNFDINVCAYVKEAYDAKKWAFVSDYARFYVLKKYGGIYLDTDVELIKNIDPIIEKGPFLALENQFYDSVAPGLGMAAYPNMSLVNKIILDYDHSHFKLSNGVYDQKPVGKRIVDNFLKNDGLKNVNGIQKVDEFLIYPSDYFCPLNFLTGITTITNNTVAIHHYASSWWSAEDIKYRKIGQKVARIFGGKAGLKVEQILKFPYSFKKKIKIMGFKKTIIFYYEKYINKSRK